MTVLQTTHTHTLPMPRQSLCQLKLEGKLRCFFEMHEQIISSKILNFIREMVLKITKIQTFALFYLHIINKTAVDARHTLHNLSYAPKHSCIRISCLPANHMGLND